MSLPATPGSPESGVHFHLGFCHLPEQRHFILGCLSRHKQSNQVSGRGHWGPSQAVNSFLVLTQDALCLLTVPIKWHCHFHSHLGVYLIVLVLQMGFAGLGGKTSFSWFLSHWDPAH